jgi:mRNA interferase MazF
MVRGEVWWALLRSPLGRRPVVVVQSDRFNRSGIETVIVALVTSNTALGAAPGNIALSKRASGLPKPSVVNVSQILTIAKSSLVERVAQLDEDAMRRVDDGLRLVLQV